MNSLDGSIHSQNGLLRSFRRVWKVAFFVAAVSALPVALLEQSVHWVIVVPICVGALIIAILEVTDEMRKSKQEFATPLKQAELVGVRGPMVAVWQTNQVFCAGIQGFGPVQFGGNFHALERVVIASDEHSSILLQARDAAGGSYRITAVNVLKALKSFAS